MATAPTRRATVGVRSNMARVLCATVSALLLAGCGPIGSGDAAPPNPPTPALAAWNDFPAGSNPRPVVWLSTPGSAPFPDANSKMAYFCNKLVLAEGLHLPPVTSGQAAANWPAGHSSSYPALSATDAFAAMTGQPTEMKRDQCAAASPLIVTAARLGTYPFGTDRGTAQMSAWLFTTAGMKGDLAFPALSPAAIWGGGMAREKSNGDAVRVDDRTLTYSFFGYWSGGPPCSADYTGAVAESSTAVAIAIKEIRHDIPGNGGCPPPALRTVTLKLGSPLAGRVVVDAQSRVVTVCPAGIPEASLPAGAKARC
jgi:hypothetical protein